MEAQLLDVVGQLLALNLSLIPVEPGGKRPTAAWKSNQEEPADADQLEQWFGNGHDYNIGIVTGTVSGVVVVDLDSRAATDWAQVHLPRTPIRTKTAKGQHLYYRHPGTPVRNKARIRSADQTIELDVRGDGGYVVGPGSVHETGVRYEMIDTWPDSLDALPVFDPAWLATGKVGKTARSWGSSDIAQERLRRARAYLRATPPAIQGQGGDDHTFRAACKLVRGFDLSESDARELLLEWNQTCVPPWTEHELDEKIAGALKYGTEPIGARAGFSITTNNRPEVREVTIGGQVPERVTGDQVMHMHNLPDRDTRPRRTVTLTPRECHPGAPCAMALEEPPRPGTLGLLGGREGVGKTICAYTLTAGITCGTLPGVYHGTPRAVIVAATEDSWEHTIVPRLMAAGADLNLVYRVDVVTAEGTDTMLSLPCDLVALEEVVHAVQAALVILDPLLSWLDTALDTHKDAEVRLALEPLVALAGATDTLVLGLIHVNKSASSDPLTLLMGSRAFAAVARSVLFVMIDPDDETARLLGQAKNNLGRVDLPTISFRIIGKQVADTREGGVLTGKLEWLGESTRSITEAVNAAAASAGDRTATSEAADWLHDFLTDQGGPCESALIKQEGWKAGHSADALKRARHSLRITC